MQKKGHLDMEAYKKKRKKSRAVTNFVTAFGANWLWEQHSKHYRTVTRNVLIAAAIE